MNDLKYFKFWCQHVLPLEYDDSLGIYQILCKVIKYLNELIENDKIMAGEIENIYSEIKTIQEWIDNFDTSYAKELIEKYISTMIFIEINNQGYIVYNIPEAWKEITFNTTGLDIELDLMKEYGHLVLSY